MIQILVSGASGFIGSHLVERLVVSGFEVVSLGRKRFDDLSTSTQHRLRGSTYVTIDMDCIHTLPSLFNETDSFSNNYEKRVFFHLAWGGEETLSCLNVNAQMKNVSRTTNAMIAAKTLGCTTFFHLGSMEEEFAEEYLSLDHRKNTEYNRHVIYAVAKLTAHKAVKIKSKEIELDYIYINHSHVMGPYDPKDSLLQVTLEKIIAGEDMSFSSGEQLWDVISVNDCVDGFTEIIKKGVPGESYWVGSGEPHCLRYYIERIFSIYPPTGSFSFGSLPYNDIKLPKHIFDTSKTKRDTGFEPKQTFDDAVVELYEHLKECRK